MRVMPPINKTPFDPTDHLLPPGHKSSSGPVVGAVIIIALLVFGGWYFWSTRPDQNTDDTLPLIPADDSAPQQ